MAKRTKLSAARRAYDPSWYLQLAYRNLFEGLLTFPLTDIEAKQVIDALGCTIGETQRDAFIRAIARAIHQYRKIAEAMCDPTSGLRWSKDQHENLRLAVKDAKSLANRLNNVSHRARFELQQPNGLMQFVEMEKQALQIGTALSVAFDRAPALSPSRNRDYAVEHLFRMLMVTWTAYTGLEPDTRTKGQCFVLFAEDMGQIFGLSIPKTRGALQKTVAKLLERERARLNKEN